MSSHQPAPPDGAPRRGAEITRERPVLALGGGPAGLTAGYLLAKAGRPVIVLESTGQVGGIARTEVRDGYRFDLGGHRFFTKVKEVDDLWHEIMKEEFLKRPRQSRIYWNKKFLEYPIQGLSFFSAAKSAFFGNKGNKIKSLISEFNYPRYGPGQMWEQMTADIREKGGEVRLNAPVTRIRMSDGGHVS